MAVHTMSVNVTVVLNLIGKGNCVPLNQEEIEFLKVEFGQGKLADSLPCHSSIEMLIGNNYYWRWI